MSPTPHSLAAFHWEGKAKKEVRSQFIVSEKKWIAECKQDQTEWNPAMLGKVVEDTMKLCLKQEIDLIQIKVLSTSE